MSTSRIYTGHGDPQPHSMGLILHSAGFGLLVAASVVVGQLLWRELLPGAVARGVELMMFSTLPFATVIAALVAGGLAYCQARWPGQSVAVLRAGVVAIRYSLLATVVGLIVITAV